MTEYSNENRGIISKNERKEKDTHPDIRGSINVAGIDYWLDGWKKDRNDGSGSFYSLSVKPKESKAQAPAPRQAPPARPPQRTAPQARTSSGFDDLEDTPF